MTREAKIRLEERHWNNSKSMLPQSFSYCLQMFTTLYFCSGGFETKDAQEQRAQSQQLGFKYLSVELIETLPRLTSPIVEKWTSAQVEKGSGPIGKDTTMWITIGNKVRPSTIWWTLYLCISKGIGLHYSKLKSLTTSLRISPPPTSTFSHLKLQP